MAVLGSGGGSRGREVERERENPREKEERGGAWRPGAAPGGHLGLKGGKQEVENGGHAQDTQVLPTGRRRNEFFGRKSPRVWKISGKNKNNTLLLDLAL
jgi:hypothetical protein